MKRRAGSVGLVGLVALMVGCGGSAPSVRPSPAPTAAASTAAAATPAPVLGTALPPGSSPRPLRMGTLAPGAYHTNFLEPEIVLNLPGGWSEFFPDDSRGLYMGSADAELLIGRPTDVIDPGTGDQAPAPEDLLAWLVAHEALNATQPTSVQISGIEAAYVDLSTTVDTDVLWGGGEGDNFHLTPGGGQRFYVIPWEGPDILAAILKPQSGSFEAAVAAGTPIVESLIVVP